MGLAISSDGQHLYAAIDGEGVYRLDINGIPAAVKQKDTRPGNFSLNQNYPNPFNQTTTIEYTVKEPCRAVLKVFDIRGREVTTLVEGHSRPGFYKVNFDAQNLPTGVYFYRIRMKDFEAVRKMVFLE